MLLLAVEGSALASCCSAGCSCTAPVCCGWLLGVSLFSASFLVDLILACSLGFDFAAAKLSIWDASFAFGVAVDPVVAEVRSAFLRCRIGRGDLRL